ncbi:MAG: helix-turn-helix transcriptional regulator [Desulfobacteraceae bacterium]|nr:helix-turn-helix transcriptional regulator [Desulfobacteraceae bacterium]
MNTINFIKQSRKDLNLTQKQFGTLFNKKRINITAYETGRAIPPGDVVLKIIEHRFPDLCLSHAHSQISNNPEIEKKQTECQKKSAA